MFIGIDHGTTAMRFAGERGQFKLSRETAKDFTIWKLIIVPDGMFQKMSNA